MSVYLSIVIPLLNEEETVEKLVSRIVEVGKEFEFDYEMILVDDGSTDNTWEKIEQLQPQVSQLRGIKLRRNYGQTSAMVAGFENAAGKIIVTMDGDLQNDPSDIPLLLDKLDQGYDIVSGWRKNRKDHYSRVLPSKIANYLISKTTGVCLHDYGCSLKVYRADCIKPIKAYGEMHRFFPALASMTGARVTEVPVNHNAREHGVSKYGFDRIFKVFSDIFAMNLIIRFSSMPLVGFSLCAIPFFILTLLFGLTGIIATLADWTPGKAQVFVIAAVLSSMAAGQLLFLGMLGELVVGMSDLSHAELPTLIKKNMHPKMDGIKQDFR
jgi:glycosyltransferase involved in cell wall biosynthesis